MARVRSRAGHRRRSHHPHRIDTEQEQLQQSSGLSEVSEMLDMGERRIGVLSQSRGKLSLHLHIK